MKAVGAFKGYKKYLKVLFFLLIVADGFESLSVFRLLNCREVLTKKKTENLAIV